MGIASTFAFPEAELDRKELENDRRFLVHLSMVYPAIVPYLKGFHFTLETWRPNRDSNGGKISATGWVRVQNHFLEKGEQPPSLSLEYADAPATVKIDPIFLNDLKVLKSLMEDSTPPLRVVRSKKHRSVAVTFVDASGGGKGVSTIDSEKNISIRMGVTTQKASSNFLELSNLVETLEKEYESGDLRNVELFLCTDNIVYELAFCKGNSNSQQLSNLVLRLRKLQLKSNFKVHVLHAAGSRMIEQGTDGLSRGLLFEGLVGERKDFLTYLPLNKSALERSTSLEN